MTTTESKITPDERSARLDGPIHGWFGLSYSNYQVIPRTLAQSMPVEWQERMVACLSELHDAFRHVEHPDAYEVTAAQESEYSELTEAQMAALNVTRPDVPDAEEADDDGSGDVFYDRDGTEHEPWHRVLIPTDDPIPAYSRGRTFVEPRGYYDCTEES